MARKCKCKICKADLTTDTAFLFEYTTEGGNKTKKYYCNEDEYNKEQEEIWYFKESQYLTDGILGYPIVNNNRNKMIMAIINSGYTKEEVYNCIKEQSNHVSECLTYRSDIDTEHGKLCYMFAIFRNTIKDITERNKRDRGKEESIKQAVESFEYIEPTVSRKKSNKSALMDILRG